MSPQSTDLLAIGHVTRDEFPGEDGWRLGGSALYAAATAARLGARTALVTRVGPDERPRLEEACAALGIELHVRPSHVTTTFSFSSDAAGHRTLRLRARARGLALVDVPESLRGTRAVVLASVAHEIDAHLREGFPRSICVLAAQGYLRAWDADGTVRPRAWEGAADAVRSVDATVLSEEDLADPRDAERWAAHGAVVVTCAERGARVLTREAAVEVAGFRADRVVDPTGAGDAFAAGLAIALAEGNELAAAARFANAVASFAVEGIGQAGLADRARVEARLGSPAG